MKQTIETSPSPTPHDVREAYKLGYLHGWRACRWEAALVIVVQQILCFAFAAWVAWADPVPVATYITGVDGEYRFLVPTACPDCPTPLPTPQQ